MKHKWHDEIVAWAGGQKVEECKAGIWYETDYPDFNAKGHEFRFLYTPPPNREWVELSDDEIDAIFPLGDDVDVIDVARAIEAKLREKNG